jgi:hypothetical protein
MLTRRRFVEYSALSSAMLAYRPLLHSSWAQTSGQRPLRLAILGSVYRFQSNMQTIADRFLVGYPYDGEWHMPDVQVVSVYVDQLARQAEAAPSPYQLAMTGAKVAPASSAKGTAGGLGRERAVGGAACGESGADDRFEQSPLAAVRLPPVQQHSGGVAVWR